MITEPVDNLYDVDMIEHKLKEEDVKAFKERNSSMNYIKDLKMRALFINNKNDPFSIKDMNEDERIENSGCLFVQSQQGGHEEWFESGKATRVRNGSSCSGHSDWRCSFC